MKKWGFLIIGSFILSGLFLTNLNFASAYSFEKDSGIKQIATKAGLGETQTPEFYIGLVLNIFFSILGIIFLILIILGGVKWMTAQGNTSRSGEAKETITKAITGLIITMAAYGLTYFIFSRII